MAKTVDNLFKTTALKEGFSFEQEVFKILKKNKWEILPNRYYFDSFLNRTREFDLLAYKYFSYKGVNIFVTLIIECKFNPHRIVFYSRKSDSTDYQAQAYIGDYIDSFFDSGDILKVFKNLKKHKPVFQLTEQVFGYQTFEETIETNKKDESKKIYKSKSDWSEKNIFSGINTTIQAVRFEQTIRDRNANLSNILFYFPVVIFSDGLYQADLEKEKKTLIRKHPIKYRAGMATEASQAPVEFTVHVCDLKGLKTISKAFDYVSHKLITAIKNSHRNKI